MNKFCTQCGEKISDGMKFCTNCGKEHTILKTQETAENISRSTDTSHEEFMHNTVDVMDNSMKTLDNISNKENFKTTSEINLHQVKQVNNPVDENSCYEVALKDTDVYPVKTSNIGTKPDEQNQQPHNEIQQLHNNNKLIWCAVFLPLINISLALVYIINSDIQLSLFISVFNFINILIAGICVIDQVKLSKLGYLTKLRTLIIFALFIPPLTTILIPIYLFKRAKALNQNKYYATSSLALLVLSFLLLGVIAQEVNLNEPPVDSDVNGNILDSVENQNVSEHETGETQVSDVTDSVYSELDIKDEQTQSDSDTFIGIDYAHYGFSDVTDFWMIYSSNPSDDSDPNVDVYLDYNMENYIYTLSPGEDANTWAINYVNTLGDDFYQLSDSNDNVLIYERVTDTVVNKVLIYRFSNTLVICSNIVNRDSMGHPELLILSQIPDFDSIMYYMGYEVTISNLTYIGDDGYSDIFYSNNTYIYTPISSTIYHFDTTYEINGLISAFATNEVSYADGYVNRVQIDRAFIY